jgi:hypothetical protein
MAAAGIGNMISDLAGLGLADQVSNSRDARHCVQLHVMCSPQLVELRGHPLLN